MDRLLAANVDLKGTAERLLGAFLKQIFEFGFYQADPHAGNFLLLPDNRVAFIDLGLVGYLTEAERNALAELFQATMGEDFERVGAIWLELARAGPEANRNAFVRGLKPILLKQINQPHERVQVGEMFIGMIYNSAKHDLNLPSELFLVFRTIAEIEGLLRWLCLEFDVIDQCKAFAEEQVAAARQPRRIAQAAGDEVRQWAGVAQRMPLEVEELVKKMTSGRFSIDLGRQGFDFVVVPTHKTAWHELSIVIHRLLKGSANNSRSILADGRAVFEDRVYLRILPLSPCSSGSYSGTPSISSR